MSNDPKDTVVDLSKLAKKDITNKLMAVWEYDRPPYYLIGEIEGWYNDGTVNVKGYNFRINPVKILPYDKDKINSLKELKDKYNLEIKELNKKFKTEAEKMLYIK